MPVVTTIEDKTARLSIQRPAKRNTLDIEMCNELKKQLLECNEDNAVRSIVISGETNVFCAGLDIDEMLNKPQEILKAFQKVIDALDYVEKPILAAVTGPAVAEGVALLYHCDLVFCGEHALFSLPNIALGKTPLYGISLLAVKSAGYKLAAQKILLSEPISPSEAIAMGIINHVLEDDKVLPQTFLAATRLGNLPPKALNATKRLLKAAYLSGTKKKKELEQETFDQLVDGAEMKEAFNAFMEKRKPNFD